MAQTPKHLVDVFGDEPINYYGHADINRLSFLRTNYDFLHKALVHPSTQFLLLDGLSPPIVEVTPRPPNALPSADERENPPFKARPPIHKLVFLSYDQVKGFVGEPFKENEATQVKQWDSKRDAVGAGRPLLVFLGIEETKNDADFSYEHENNCSYRGRAHFAVDISEGYLKSAALQQEAAKLKKDHAELANGFEIRFNPFGIRLTVEESTLLAQARQYVDWNARNRFCGGCGALNMSVNGGCKLTCPPTDAGKELDPCPTRGAITNLHFPRTDTSIIAAVINYQGTKILLGRGRRFPEGFYSCLAGFLEPAETIEDCVRREIWEEAGVKVGRVVMYSTQPWPYPANIMVGCIAQIADDSEASHKIHLGHDPELADAQWYTYDEAREALKYSGIGTFGKRPEGLAKGAPQLPAPEAVAWTLIDAVVNDRVRGLSTSKQPKI